MVQNKLIHFIGFQTNMKIKHFRLGTNGIFITSIKIFSGNMLVLPFLGTIRVKIWSFFLKLSPPFVPKLSFNLTRAVQMRFALLLPYKEYWDQGVSEMASAPWSYQKNICVFNKFIGPGYPILYQGLK